MPDVIEAELAFVRPEDAGPDPVRPGLLRARSRDRLPIPGDFDLRRCAIRDCAALEGFDPTLAQQGFEQLDLSGLERLQVVLERVRVAGRLTSADERAIRRELRGRRLQLRGGTRLRLLHIAAEGFIMRRAGPNALALAPGGPGPGDPHDAAVNVHADQDVDGTPLRQLMRGQAPRLLRHDSPTHKNHGSPLCVLNLWIPLAQVTRPLALMDTSSLDRRRHQLGYALPTDAFLQRDEDRRVNDIWAFIHHADQRWYFDSDMSGRAWVFETLGTPHGSFILPAEEHAEARYLALAAARRALERGDTAALAEALARSPGELPDATPPSLRRAIAAMDELLAQARAGIDTEDGARWHERASRAMDAVIRSSIELRALAWISR